MGAGGAPTKYKVEYNEQARKLCLLGYTDKKLADFFYVSEATINNWKIEYPKFLESLKAGKEYADAIVANSLYNRAKGMKVKEERTDANNETTVIIKELPPDATSGIFWLKNRQPDEFRDKRDVEHSGQIAMPAIEIGKAGDDKNGKEKD